MVNKSALKPSLDWLSDTSVFAVNRLPAHSDHRYYETIEEARQKQPMAMRHSLNGLWKFSYAPNPASRAAAFYEPDFPCARWSDIQVPGHIQLQGYGQAHYVNTMYPWDGHHDIRPPHIPASDNPVGSYVTFFEVPGRWQNKPVFISFQGVESAFYVWLNGEFVGYSEDSFTPADFDLTPFLTDGENKLAVEVYQRSTGSWLEDQDFWRFSGIFRDVYLYTAPRLHLEDLYVKAELDDTYENGLLSARCRFAGRPAQIVAELFDESGALIASHTGQETEFTMPVARPGLWSAEQPLLYQLVIQLLDEDGALAEVIPQQVGFRRFELIDRVMHLNGQRIVFKGVNRHEFNCRTGRAVTKADMLWDIQTFKQHNINAVRTSHYPNQTEWYELCDEYGIYVIDEMNLETHGSWQKMGKVEPSWNIPGSKPEWQAIVMDRAVSMFERDKNHPSILIWSCGNESFAGDVILEVSRYFKKADPGRLVHYEGVFHARDYDSASDMESRMYAKPADIEAYLQNSPAKPYISCEYMHAMGNSLGGMYKYTELENKYTMYQGGFIWDFIDQALVKKDRFGKEFLAYGGDFGDRPTDYGFCTNGIVYASRQLSPKMQEVKFLYQNVTLTPDQQGVFVANQNLFADLSAYQLVYRLHRDGELQYENMLEANAAPQSTARAEFHWPDGAFAESGEYCIDVSLQLKADTLWARAGFEVAFGQFVFGQRMKRQMPENGRLTVARGDVTIGVHGRGFSALFSRQHGSLVSLNYAGDELISMPPAPLFWRATTDNDRGFAHGFDAGVWYAASLARRCTEVTVEEAPGRVVVSFTYRFSIHERMRVTARYTVFADGRLHVAADCLGASGLPNVPIFALSFKVPADYHHLDWYALGPEENYSDRNRGARLGRFQNTAESNVSAYVMPQESGNRTGVRRLDVTDQAGRGLRIEAGSEPLECGASPYTAFELENAQHSFELPPVHYTVLTIAGRQMGVGGDDSWGAPVHPEHLLAADEPLGFTFWIKPLF